MKSLRDFIVRSDENLLKSERREAKVFREMNQREIMRPYIKGVKTGAKWLLYLACAATLAVELGNGMKESIPKRETHSYQQYQNTAISAEYINNQVLLYLILSGLW